MRLIDTTCSHCGAQLQFDADRKVAYCEYCGAQLLLDDEIQHVSFDDAEDAGYQFEKGRQRAQREAYAQQTTYTAPQKRHTVWWVLGWIFIFPIPLTILIARKDELKTAVKIGIILVAWLAYFALVTASNVYNKSTNDITYSYSSEY